MRITKTVCIHSTGDIWTITNTSLSGYKDLCAVDNIANNVWFKRLLVVSYTNGIKYSDDNGETWNLDTTKTGFDHIGVARADKTLAQYLVASGSGAQSTGIWYSNKMSSGFSWQRSNITTGTYQGFYENPFKPNHILAGGSGMSQGAVTCQGILYSDTRGTTWNTSNKTDGVWYTFCAASATEIYAGSKDNGLWYSSDGGKNWTQTGFTTGSVISIYITSTKRIIIGVSISSTSGNAGTYYSDDKGATWTKINVNGSTGSDIISCIVKLSSGRLLGLSSYVMYSDDNGLNWKKSTKSNLGGVAINYSTPNGNNMVLLPNERAIFINSSNKIKYSDAEYADITTYSVTPHLTGKQAKKLVQQCKAYVQALKNGN